MIEIIMFLKHPKKFYENLDSNKINIKPFIIIISLYLIGTLITKNLYAENLRDLILNTGTNQKEEIDLIIKNQTITSFIINPILPLIAIFVKSYLLNGISYFDGVGELKDSINVVSHAYIVVAIGNLFNSLLSLIFNNYNLSLSLNLLLDLKQNSYLYSLIESVNPFVIIYQIITIIGISVLYKVEYKRAAIFVIGTWITWLLIFSGINSFVG
jgi:hypothetical protein